MGRPHPSAPLIGLVEAVPPPYITAFRFCRRKKKSSAKDEIRLLTVGSKISLHSLWKEPRIRSNHLPTMPKTFQKVTKHIAKKRGAVEALHEFSRDARRLRRANAREDRVARVSANMSRARQTYGTAILVAILCFVLR